MGSKRCIVFPGVTNDGLLPAEKVVTDFDGQSSATRHFSILEMWIGKVCQAESSGGMCPWKQIWFYCKALPQWVKEIFNMQKTQKKTDETCAH